MNCSVGTRDKGFKLGESRFRLAVGRKTSTMSVVKYWLREVSTACPTHGNVQG